MCRSIHQGGRRCAGCGYSAKQNGNRRSNRIARRKLSEYLLAEGLPEAAKAVLHAPPSVVPVILAKLDLDTESILGDTPPPSTHAMSDAIKAQAEEIAEMAQAEQKGELNSPKDKIKAMIAEAEEKVAAAAKREDDLRKAKNRATTKRRKLQKQFEAFSADPSDEASAEDLELITAYHDAIAEENAAKDAYEQAKKDTKAAEAAIVGDLHALKKESFDEEEYDAYCAELDDDQISAIREAAGSIHADAINDALTKAGEPAISAEKRDTSVYTSGQITIADPDGSTKTLEGRRLDGGVAIVREGYSNFAVLVDPSGDGVYHRVSHASGKTEAVAKASRITQFTQVPSVDDAENPTVREVAKHRQELLVEALKKQALTGSVEDAQKVLDLGRANIAATTAEGFGDATVADIADARRRHVRRVRVANAEARGNEARKAALATGASKAAADAAYKEAYRKALGTPTQGGGVIPHFEHKIPPDTIGQQQWTKLSHSGIRTFGTESADDYAVIHDRSGDLKAWGFSSISGTPTSVSELNVTSTAKAQETNSGFVKKVLNAKERAALTRYTGGEYTTINAAITGRTENPSADIKGCVGYLKSVFEKHAKYTPADEPMTLLRGTKIPSGWKGTPSEYIESVFKPGEKMQIGKVTSCTTNAGTACGFAGHPPYMMVIQTRAGIPVKEISSHSGEDEIILPIGHDLRCVRVDTNGINGTPTVYLVAEDLVAEAQDFGGPKGGEKKSSIAA